MRRSAWVWVFAVATCAGAGCSSCKKEGVGGGATDGGGQVAVAAPSLRPIGMDDPFARLSADAARQLNIGYRALRTKEYDPAREAFTQVTVLAPDYSPARMQLVRALVLGGKLGEVPDAWAALLARDEVQYAGKLDKSKEMAPLRASPSWAQVETAERDYRYAYGKGLERGVFFVARAKQPGVLKWDEAGSAKLDPSQEAYHYDPQTQKYRRLTATDGHLFAIAPSPDRKRLAFVVARKLTKEGDALKFADPEGGYLDFQTMETVGPAKIPGAVGEIELGFTAAGEAVFGADGKRFLFDSAHTALAAMDAAPAPLRPTVMVRPQMVARTAAADAPALEEGRKSFKAGGETVRAAREIDPASFEWSPGKKRLAWSGAIDACKALEAAEKNELFAWDAEKKQASRVAQAISFFDTVWLDDDKLVYEGGVGKEGKLHVIDLPTRDDVVLKPKQGAGLFGYPDLVCEKPTDEPVEADEPEETGD